MAAKREAPGPPPPPAAGKPQESVGGFNTRILDQAAKVCTLLTQS